MDFTDIERNYIVEFLNINNCLITDKIYDSAINLINQEEVIMTPEIELWLTAYDNKNIKTRNVKLLKYLHLNYFDALPDELISKIMSFIKNYDNTKYLNKKFYNLYNHHQHDKYFKYEWCKNILYENEYTESHIKMVDHIVNVLNPDSGKLMLYNSDCKLMRLYTEKIVKKVSNYFLTEGGKIIGLNNTMMNISLHVTDMIYDNVIYFLSKGKVYKANSIEWLSIFSYKCRQNKFENHTLQLPIDNVISITILDHILYLLKSNGQLYKYSNELELIYENILYCCADQKLYMVTFDNQLIVDNVKTEHMIDRLIPGFKVLLVTGNSFYIYGDTLGLITDNVDHVVLSTFNIYTIIKNKIYKDGLYLCNGKSCFYNGNIYIIQ